jgi:hypothetical protein
VSEPEGKEGAGTVLLGLVLLLVVVVLAIDAAGNPELQRRFGRDPGPALQPRVMLGLLGGGALVLIAQGLHRVAKAGWRVGNPLAGVDRLLLPAFMVACMLAFVQVAPVLGFLPTAIAFTAGWAVILVAQDEGLRLSWRLAAMIGAAVAAAGAMYYVFQRLIGVPFP